MNLKASFILLAASCLLVGVNGHARACRKILQQIPAGISNNGQIIPTDHILNGAPALPPNIVVPDVAPAPVNTIANLASAPVDEIAPLRTGAFLDNLNASATPEGLTDLAPIGSSPLRNINEAESPLDITSQFPFSISPEVVTPSSSVGDANQDVSDLNLPLSSPAEAPAINNAPNGSLNISSALAGSNLEYAQPQDQAFAPDTILEQNVATAPAPNSNGTLIILPPTNGPSVADVDSPAPNANTSDVSAPASSPDDTEASSSPPSGSLTRTAGEYQQCGGNGAYCQDYENCENRVWANCTSDFRCFKQSSYYYQCLPYSQGVNNPAFSYAQG